MPSETPNEATVFNTARKIASAADREAYLAEACMGDTALRKRVDKLLSAFAAESQYLEQPAMQIEATILTNSSGGNVAAALDAGLAPAFVEGEVLILGDGSHSVLKMLCQTMDKVPRVALRESALEVGEPILKPKSPEMPQKDSDSRYQLQGEIARGGMGAILKGRDTDLGRDLAIKVLLDQHKDRPDVVQRFIEEAQIGGQLQHPGIAPVYELGQFADRRPFFSMKLVKGETFSKLLADRANPATDRGRFVGIFEQICQTVAYAHSRGVIHRDLKPANIMVGAFGEVQVMDWGLAKVLQTGGVADEKKTHDQQQGQSIIRTLRSQVGSDPPVSSRSSGSSTENAQSSRPLYGSQTQMGSIMGTPAYMPPEQALGEVDLMDERADVFGLGAILCEILTGMPPYVGSDGTQVYRMASRGKLTDCFARLDACGADAELVALTKQCLELEPKDRPRDAGVLADRITTHLASVESRLHAAELQSAAEAARAEEALQTAKEHELAASAERRARKLQMELAAVVLCVLTVGGIAATWTAAVQSRLKNDALFAEQNANKAREHAENEQARAESEKARAETEKSRAEVAQRQAEDEKIRSVNMLADMQTERGIQAGRAGQAAMAALWFANAAALTPHDPERQVANQRRALTWSGEALQPVALLNAGQDAKRIEFQPGGSLLMTVQANGLRVWDWRDEVALPWSEQLPLANDAAMSPDGRSIAVLLTTGEVRLQEPASGKVLRTFNAVGGMYLIEWSPDGSRVAVAGTQLQVWNVSGEPVKESDWAHPVLISGMRFSRSGQRIVSCSHDNLARVFAINDANSPAPLYAPLDHRSGIKRRESSPVFCDDDRRLVTLSSETKQPVLHDATTGTALPVEWKFPPYMDRSLDVSADGRWVSVAGAQDGALLSADGKTSLVLPHANHLHLALFAPNTQTLATLGYEGVVRLFSMSDLTRGVVGSPTTLPQRNTFANGVFSPDSQALAISANQQVVVWERQPSSAVVGLVPLVAGFWRPRPSFDGRLVSPGVFHEFFYENFPTGGKELKVSRLVDGSAAGPTISLPGLLRDSCVCADNASVAAVTVDQTRGWLSLFDIATGVEKWSPIELPSPPMSVAARPGQQQLAVLCQNGDLLLVDATRGVVTHKHPSPGLSGFITHARVVYSPDGKTIVTIPQNSVVSIREAETGELRCKPFSPLIEGGVCRSIAFSPDNRLLATIVTGKNMAQVWNLSTGEKVGVGMSHPGDHFGLWSVIFSPDGQRLLTSHKDGRIRTFNWQTGEIIGTPLQHADEANDMAFTRDGRHLLVSVRNSKVHVWDVATGKLAVPLLSVLNSDGGGALAISGTRAVVTSNNQHAVLDLSVMLPPINEDVTSQLRRAELATNHKLQVGDLVPLDSHEWNERWEQLVAARLTSEQAVDLLAQAFDEASDAVAQNLVVARASQRGLLEKLQALRPKSLPLLIALAHKGSRSHLGQSVGQIPNATAPNEAHRLATVAMATASTERLRNEVLAQLREIAAKGPIEPSLMKSLAQLLTDDAPRGRWLPLEPLAMRGAAETTFKRESNGFILAGQGGSEPDTYSIEARPRVKHIAALRLDVAPHASLPNGGAGHFSGDFHLMEVRARVRRADGTETALNFNRAAADHVRDLDPYTKLTDGPWGVLDGSRATRWDISPVQTLPHWLVVIPDSVCDVAETDTLIVELDSGNEMWPLARLGHFRLSVSEDSRASMADELIAAVRKNDLHAEDSLAAACLVIGEAQSAIDVLKHAPQADSRNKLLRALLLATAQYQLGQRDAAKQLAEAGVAAGVLENSPHSLTGFFDSALRRFAQRPLSDVARITPAESILDSPEFKQAAVSEQLAMQGKWAAAAKAEEEGLNLNPTYRGMFAYTAALLMLAGDVEGHRKFCNRAMKPFEPVTEADVADSICKSCLLAPDAVSLDRLPIKVLREGITDPKNEPFKHYLIACHTLVLHRTGQHAEAIAESKKVPDLSGVVGALVLVSRALAEEKFGQHEQAIRTLAVAEALIPTELSTLGTDKHKGRAIVPREIISVDWLIPEVLRREATALIRK